MDDWTVGGVPLRGRAGQPSEIVSSVRLARRVDWKLTAILDALECVGSQFREFPVQSTRAIYNANSRSTSPGLPRFQPVL